MGHFKVSFFSPNNLSICSWYKETLVLLVVLLVGVPVLVGLASSDCSPVVVHMPIAHLDWLQHSETPKRKVDSKNSVFKSKLNIRTYFLP